MDGKLSSDVEVLSLPRGIYLFSVRSAVPSSAGLDGQVVLPGLHVGLCPGGSPESVEFVSAPSSSGFWLYKPDDAIVVRILSDTLPFLLTSIRLDKTAPLEIEIQRLDESNQSELASEVHPGNNLEEPKRRGLRTQIITHVQNRGDLTFLDETWAGLVNQRLWIEAFEIVPRERLQPEDIEYKALDAAGAETPWIKGGETCGTRGLGVPLLGFAVRSSPGAGPRKFDLEYFGRFLSGQTIGPARNGAPVFSSRRGDPLECIHLAIVPATSESAPASVPDPIKTASEPKRRSLGAKFGIFREDAREVQPRPKLRSMDRRHRSAAGAERGRAGGASE